MWNLALANVQHGRFDTRKTRKLMKQLGIPDALRLSEKQILGRLGKAKQEYRENKEKAWELREAFQAKVNSHRAAKFNTSIETQEKITKNAFRQKNMFRRIEEVVKPKPKQGITYVEITDEYDITHECLTKKEIEEACMTEGYERYETNLKRDMGYPFQLSKSVLL